MKFINDTDFITVDNKLTAECILVLLFIAFVHV